MLPALLRVFTCYQHIYFVDVQNIKINLALKQNINQKLIPWAGEMTL